MFITSEKFVHPFITREGKPRAFVPFAGLDCLWFNTGTLCNLSCKNCYIESTPTNDRLVYITLDEVKSLLDECDEIDQRPPLLGFTGGEPFMNPYFIEIMRHTLEREHSILILTNAMKPMMKRKDDIDALQKKYGDLVQFRISIDHYTQELHEKERGKRTWDVMLKGIQWLVDNECKFSIAGRSFGEGDEMLIRKGYQQLFDTMGWDVDADNPEQLILFPEMDLNEDVPEITTECWGVLSKNPNDMMCSNSRMVVKEKGADAVSVIACTLLPYEKELNYGSSIKESMQTTYLNHQYCAQFCVLGGCSCEG